MFICSDQLNSPYDNNAHIFRLSFLFQYLICLSKQFLFLCAVHAGGTLPEQGDKIFDSSDYNVFRSISFVLHRHFSICCSIRRLMFPTYLFKVDRLQMIVVAKNLSVLQLFISRMPKMCAILQLVSAPLNPIPITDHFRRSHPQCEHSCGQHIYMSKENNAK